MLTARRIRGRVAIPEAIGRAYHRKHRATTMNTRERVEALWALYNQLDALITPDEMETYPALDHLGDLVSDLEADLEE